MYIWTLDIEITKPKRWENEFLTIHLIICYVLHQMDSAQDM